jgi:hypothetical protein
VSVVDVDALPLVDLEAVDKTRIVRGRRGRKTNLKTLSFGRLGFEANSLSV